jgi:hypothetical protein
MTRRWTFVSVVTLLSGALLGQTSDAPPAFDLADVHPSPPSSIYSCAAASFEAADTMCAPQAWLI